MNNFFNMLPTFFTVSTILIFTGFYLFINVIFSGWLANQKGRSVGNWIVLSLFFGPVALITVGLSPNLKEESLLKSIKENIEAQSSNNSIQPNFKTKNEAINSTIKEDIESKNSTLLNQNEYDQLSFEGKNRYYRKIAKIIEDNNTNKQKVKIYAQHLYDLGYIGCKKYLK